MKVTLKKMCKEKKERLILEKLSPPVDLGGWT